MSSSFSAAPVSAWRGTEAVAVGTSLLLEASAGTGKTWQIAHLVARLVAEQELPIDRILLITFTTAATAELRDRVRRRLAELQQALRQEELPESADSLLRGLCEGPQRAPKLARVTAALTGFDQAPISTIHGFCQRMLTQLAFESGQSPGLEVLAETQPLADELINDELAQLFAHADEQGVATAQALGWTRAGLMALAKPMLGAVAPQLQPPARDGAPQLLDVLVQWQRQAAELLAWLLDPQTGGQAIAAMQQEMARPTKSAARKGDTVRGFSGTFGAKQLSSLPLLMEWLAAGAPGDAMKDQLAPWDLSAALSKWQSSEPFDQFAGAALFQRIPALGQQLGHLTAQVRSGFAQRVRRHIDTELERRGVVSYDAMLWRLAERIQAEGPGGALAAAIRQRFDVALVDEFQDTDAAQWAVLSAAFRCADRRLLLIGDPKQAIYAFRGADVHVYLQAAEGTPDRRPTRATMATNWRSDPALVQAMNHLWAAQSQAFGKVPFDYIEVDAARQQPQQALSGVRTDGEPRRALELRWLDARTESSDSVPGFISAKDRATVLVVRALVREVVDLLGVQTELQSVKAEQVGQKARLRPQDLAVLVRTNLQGELVRQALAAAGVAAVASSADAVVQSEAADWLLAWLDALAQPGYEKAARTAVVTPVFGWKIPELAAALRTHQEQLLAQESSGAPKLTAAAGERVWGEWLADLADWAGRWHQRGFVAIWEQALAKHSALPRLLASERGERHATDLRHLVELCHAEDRAHRHGPAGLADWLRAQRTEVSEEQSLRLESDAAAVQIVTIHKSKGLEYPVVLLPFLWETRRATADSGQPLLYHGEHGAMLNLQAAGAPERDAVLAVLAEEKRQEEARVLYVALTRAVHHVVAWLIPAGDTADRPADNAFAQLLLRQRDQQGHWISDDLPASLAGKKGAPPPDPQPWVTRLEELCAQSHGTIGLRVEPPFLGPQLRAQPLEIPALDLQPLRWSDRRLSDGWMVTSYSSLTRGRSWDGDNHRSEVRIAAPATAPALDPTLQKTQLAAEEALILAAAEELADQPDDQLPDDQQPDDQLPDVLQQDDQPRQAQVDESAALLAWRALGAGTDVGTWVHAILEHLDFATAAAKDGRAVEVLAADLGRRYGIRRDNQSAALSGLVPQWLATPLDAPQGLPAGFSLRQLPQADRLDELPFDLALGRSQQDDRRLDSAEVHAALRAAVQQAAAPHPEAGQWLTSALEDGNLFPQIHGILTGTIDLVLRADGRYFVADYKTNRLKNRDGEVLAAGDYTRAALAGAMAEHGYHLQALLYTVALHRWLRQRLGAAYDYDQHLGGHLYLFLRGMDGGQQRGQDGACSGVFVDRWPRLVVETLDQALWPQGDGRGGHR